MFSMKNCKISQYICIYFCNVNERSAIEPLQTFPVQALLKCQFTFFFFLPLTSLMTQFITTKISQTRLVDENK